MGIRDRIKRRLPIIGAGGSTGSQSNPTPSTPSPVARPAPAWSPPPEPESPRGDRPVQEYLSDLTSSNKIVLFMKGNPSNPQCGFSGRAVSILQSYGHPVEHFDVFLDPEVRQGVKDFSDWPTIPQVYVDGEFLGGSDILQQMHENGELREAIDEAMGATKSE
jgi:monothiol glutaredoxin